VITLYGTPLSRAARCLWMLEEVGVPFTHVPTHFAGEAQKPEFRRLNPNGRVPVLDDDGTIVWESMAINLHLADRYGKDLAPRDFAERAHVYQWSFWGVTEIEPGLIEALAHRMLPEAQRKPELAAAGEAKLTRPLKVLDGVLGAGSWLAADRFTVADLNVASVLVISQLARIDLGPYPNVGRWAASCWGRPAHQRAGARR